MNQNAKQRYYQKHGPTLIHKHKHQNTNEETSQTLDTPFTVEKGLNAIKADSGQASQERRPKLKREYSVGSESDL